MTDEFRKQFTKLDRQRRELLERLEELSDTQLAFRPTPTCWSIVDVIQHLVLVEEGMVRTAQRLSAEIPVHARRRSPYWYARVMLVMRTGIRVQVPASIPHLLPTGHIPLAELVPRWETARLVLKEYLNGLSPKEWRQPVFRHPRAGWMTPSQGLRLIQAHCDHHLRQIFRIQRAPGFPGGRPTAVDLNPVPSSATER